MFNLLWEKEINKEMDGDEMAQCERALRKIYPSIHPFNQFSTDKCADASVMQVHNVRPIYWLFIYI